MANWLKGMFSSYRDVAPESGPTEQKNGVNINELMDLRFGPNTVSGVAMSPSLAMQVSTVYACIRVVSESFAQLPVAVVKRDRTTGTRTKDYEHNIYTLLGVRPNSWMTPFEFHEQLVSHVMLRGNFVAAKVKSSDGRILELLPIHPDSVSCSQTTNYDLLYQVRLSDGKIMTLGQEDIFHVRGPSDNGYWGYSVVTKQRETLGLAATTLQHGAALFGNGAKPGGILYHPEKMGDDAQRRLKESWQDAFRGVNSSSTAVLEEGMKWEQITMTSEDSQFLETRKFTRSEIAALFRVPPHKIGDMEHATFSNIEHQSLEFVQDAILPMAVRVEQAIQRDLMPVRHRYTHSAKYNLDGLLRGDIKTRFETYAIAIQWGIYNPDECRELEDRNPRLKGDVYLSPMNMIPADMLGKVPPKDTPADTPAKDEEAAKKNEYHANVLTLLDRLNG